MYYNFADRFNEIESYNEYAKRWLSYYNFTVSFTSKLDWDVSDIPDVYDYNRIKLNMNLILQALSLIRMDISAAIHQNFDNVKAQELQNRLTDYLRWIGNRQFKHRISGQYVCGSEEVVFT